MELLPRLLERRREGALTVVYQTAVLAYVEPERRERVYAALAEAGKRAPLAYVGTHTPRDGADTYWGLRIHEWPGGEAEIVAHADYHGAWIEWLA